MTEKLPATAFDSLFTFVKDDQPVVLKVSGSHSHAEDTEDRIKRTARLKMKKMTLDRPDKSCKEVYEDVLAASIAELRDKHSAEEIGAAIPNYNGIRSSLQRTRVKVRPPLPASRNDVRLEGPWATTRDGEAFFLFDSDGIDDGARIIGFSTEEAMSVLCRAPAIYMDGTFRVVPDIFAQLYTLHAVYKGKMMPFVYFLLPDKQKETYVRMFGLLQRYASSKGLNFRPPKFQLDYEVAVLVAIRESFPQALTKGCNVHYTQALYKKVQTVGLKSAYDNDIAVKRLVSRGSE